MRNYLKELAAIRNGDFKRGPKEKKGIKAISDKKAAQMAEDKKQCGEEDPAKEKWFKARRKELSGTCGCGCGNRSQKQDDTFFRASIAHIFPKRTFLSIQFHPLNWVERSFFGGCHSVMDDTSIDRWPNMEDWDIIKERFHTLAPHLTDEERATKFYSHLEKLVYAN